MYELKYTLTRSFQKHEGQWKGAYASSGSSRFKDPEALLAFIVTEVNVEGNVLNIVQISEI